MALLTILDIVTRACDEMGLPRPSTLFASTNPDPVQMRAHANAAGLHLMTSHSWGDLTTLGSFSTVSGTSDYTFATMSITDFDRFVPETHWDRTNDQFIIGPSIPQTDRWRQESGVAQASINKFYRALGKTNGIRIWPTPSATETLVFEYISKNWARATGGVTPKVEFDTDTDESVFEPTLMVKEIKWRFLAAKGLPTAEYAKTECDAYFERLVAADLGGKTIDLSGVPERDFLDVSIPDGSWGI